MVELLVSIGILAVIVGIGGDILATVIRAYRKAELLSLIERNGNYAIGLLEQDVRSSIDLKVYDSSNVAYPDSNPDQQGNKVRIGIPSGTGNTFRRYEIQYCTAGNLGSIAVDPDDDDLNYEEVVGSGLDLTEIDFLDERLAVIDFELALGQPALVNSIRRIKNSSGQKTYDIVYISFALGAGGADPCVNPQVRAFFQTSVNLFGGLQ